MKTLYLRTILLTGILMASIAPSGQAQSPGSTIKEETVTYKSGEVTLKGFVAYDSRIAGKRPVILVVHEWWGLNDYPRMRARRLAALGYFAMAVDMFGEGKIAANPKEAMALTMPFYKDPLLVKQRISAAVRKAREYPQADPANMAAIGYCFGGNVVLNAAKLGAEFKGVVSFHGGLGGAPADRKLLKASILVCHGGADKFISQADVDAFKHQMDSIHADYDFRVYPGATHAFTNPDATKTGKAFDLPIEYNEAGDKNSWDDMKVFLTRIFNSKK